MKQWSRQWPDWSSALVGDFYNMSMLCVWLE